MTWLRKQLETADVDLLREMVRAFAETLMSADADAVCGASYGERSEERVNRRNGYRERDFDTRAGTVELRVPKLRQGTLLPRVALRTPQARRTGPHRRHLRVLRARRLHAPGGRPRESPGPGGHLQEPGLGASEEPGRGGGRLPLPAPRHRPLPLPVAGRPRPQGPGGGTGGGRSGGSARQPCLRKAIGRSWASTSSPPRTARAGRPSCATLPPGASPTSGWSSPTITVASRPPSRPSCRFFLAAMPDPLHEERPLPGASLRAAVRGHAGPHHLCPALGGRGGGPTRPRDRAARGSVPRRGAHAGRGRPRHHRLCLLPHRTLAADLVEQPPGALEPGDPPADGCRGHLPRPGFDPASGGRRPRGAT